MAFANRLNYHTNLHIWFTTTCAISAYHHSCEFKSCSWQGILDTTLCNKICQFSPGTPVPWTTTVFWTSSRHI